MCGVKLMINIRQIISILVFKPINSICKCFLEGFVWDKQIRTILKGKLAKIYLKKYVNRISKMKFEGFPDQPKPKIIWQYWEQGWNNAPDIVQACVKSVEKYKNGCEHILLDKNSIKNYVDIPQYIYDLKDRGIINSAHFSDIVRTYLLCKHGGTWVDATVLFTQNLPEYIINADLFVFQNDLKRDIDGLNMASYFISSKPHNLILERCREIFELYWRENLFLNNYFMFLHAFTMLTRSAKDAKEIFSKIPFFSFVSVQRFQSEILTPYTPERMEQIKSISPIHKLSYKANVLSKHAPMNIEGTFYEKLIKEGLD